MLSSDQVFTAYVNKGWCCAQRNEDETKRGTDSIHCAPQVAKVPRAGVSGHKIKDHDMSFAHAGLMKACTDLIVLSPSLQLFNPLIHLL